MKLMTKFGLPTLGLIALTCSPLKAQEEATSGKTSVTLDFAALESAASLTFDSVNNTANPAAGFPAAFAITGDTPFQYNLNPFAPVGGTISHTGSLTFLISGTTTPVEVGEFEIGFDPSRSSTNTSGFFVEDTVSGLGILFDVGIPDPLTAGPDGVVIESPLLVSPEFATYLTTNSLATSDLTGVEIGAAQVNSSPQPLTVTMGTTSVDLDFDTLASAASLEFTAVDNTGIPATGFPAGFAITSASPFQYSIDPFAPIGGNISHTGSVTFTVSGTETLVQVGNFNIGYDGTRATNGNSGFFAEDTISELGILFDVADPTTLDAGPDGFYAEADLNVSPEFATYLSDNGLAESDLTGATIGSAQIDGIPDMSDYTPPEDNELLNISTRCFVGDAAFTDLANASIIIGGSDPATVVFRGRSVSISDSITANKLSDPVIEVIQVGVGSLGTNDNWADAENLDLVSGTTLDPAVIGMDANESILILENLEPGAYSLRITSGVPGETGLVIAEAFAVRN